MRRARLTLDDLRRTERPVWTLVIRPQGAAGEEWREERLRMFEIVQMLPALPAMLNRHWGSTWEIYRGEELRCRIQTIGIDPPADIIQTTRERGAL